VLAALAALLSTFVVMTVSNPAHAAYGCDNVPQGDYATTVYNSWDEDEGKYGAHLVVFWLKWWERTFNVAGSDTEGNDSDSPQMKTFTITQSRTYTVQNTFKASSSSTVEFLKVKLSSSYEYTQQITNSYTTSSSVTYQETLPAHVAKKVYNGVDAINVRFDVATWFLDQGKCWWRPNLTAYDVYQNVPTTNERREVKQLPVINPGGVVDAVDYNYNIRPCEIVSLFGNGFEAPSRVILRQGGNTWYVGAGSAWWYESWNQINATLPCDIQPNNYVSVSVESNKTLERVETPWPRFVFISP